MLCNALIQLHFDDACHGWYPNLTEKMKKKIQITYAKYMHKILPNTRQNVSHI